MAHNYPGITPYAYCANNPIKYIDSDGKAFNAAAAAVGAGAGAIIGGGINLFKQWNSGEDINWQEVGAHALGGAVTGGLAGLTMGASLAASGSAVVVEGLVVGSGATVVGGMVTRATDGDDDTEVFDGGAITVDAIGGGIGGTGGAALGEAVKDGVKEVIKAGYKEIAKETGKKITSYGTKQGAKGLAVSTSAKGLVPITTSVSTGSSAIIGSAVTSDSYINAPQL